MATNSKALLHALNKPISSTSLAFFRWVFGIMMLISTLRFWMKGWIPTHFTQTKLQFKYFGFEWVEVLPLPMLYALHALLIVSSIAFMLGWHYRIASVLLFLSFTYLQLIDLTYYLNHYYFMSLVSLLMIFLPAAHSYALDVRSGRVAGMKEVPAWTIWSIKGLLGIVYVYAGLAKIQPEWLMEALPLRIWLPAHAEMPLIGGLFSWKYSPWLFSWAGMLFDCSVFFLLLWKRSRLFAYIAVLIFHGLTGLLFQIGIFPMAMILSTLIFFSAEFHERLLQNLCAFCLPEKAHFAVLNRSNWHLKGAGLALWSAFFAFQLLFPLRYLLYPGDHFWTEEGYRFGWRVMLVEKSGNADFFIRQHGKESEQLVQNSAFLSRHQEKQMAFQPDMILQYAHWLQRHYEKKGLDIDQVRAEVYVTLNGRASRLLIDSSQNLLALEDNWQHKNWILPHPDVR
jgi:hypothetical protein